MTVIAIMLVVLAIYALVMRWDIRRASRKMVQERSQRRIDALHAEILPGTSVDPYTPGDGVYGPLNQPTEAEIEMIVNSIDIEWEHAAWI